MLVRAQREGSRAVPEAGEDRDVYSTGCYCNVCVFPQFVLGLRVHAGRTPEHVLFSGTCE